MIMLKSNPGSEFDYLRRILELEDLLIVRQDEIDRLNLVIHGLEVVIDLNNKKEK